MAKPGGFGSERWRWFGREEISRGGFVFLEVLTEVNWTRVKGFGWTGLVDWIFVIWAQSVDQASGLGYLLFVIRFWFF